MFDYIIMRCKLSINILQTYLYFSYHLSFSIRYITFENCLQMTFSKIASLNGIHMFLKSQDITLLNTDLPDTTVVWKEFEDCIILIVIASGVTKYVLDKFLDATFGAMVLFTGVDEIKNTKNIERLKKDMRLCGPIIDKLMDCLDIGDKISAKTDMVNMTECIISPENHLLQVAEFLTDLI